MKHELYGVAVWQGLSLVVDGNGKIRAWMDNPLAVQEFIQFDKAVDLSGFP